MELHGSRSLRVAAGQARALAHLPREGVTWVPELQSAEGRSAARVREAGGLRLWQRCCVGRTEEADQAGGCGQDLDVQGLADVGLVHDRRLLAICAHAHRLERPRPQVMGQRTRSHACAADAVGAIVLLKHTGTCATAHCERFTLTR